MPVGAVADMVPGDNGMVSVGPSDVAQGVVISAPNAIGIESQGALTVDDMTVGAVGVSGDAANNIFVLDSVESVPFTLLARGDVSVNALLTVLNGKQFAIKAFDASAADFAFAASEVVVGATDDNASLDVDTNGDFTVTGNIKAYGDFSVTANGVTAGNVSAHNGAFDIDSAGAVKLNSIIADGSGTVDIVSDAGIEIVDAFQKSGSGDVLLSAQGDITVGGDFENKSADNMTVSANNFTVDGAVTNDTGATLTVNASSLTVNGGTSGDGSLLNAGDFSATIQNDAYFENGISLDGMGTENSFSLDVGSLEFGAGADEEAWFGFFSNSLQNFELAIRKEDLNLSTVSVFNGANSEVNANMSLLAQNISLANVNNSAKSLSVKAQASNGGNVTIAGKLLGQAGADTDIVASGTISVGQEVSNSGDMLINASEIILADVSNVGTVQENASLEISSLFDNTGKIVIDGNVVNTNGVLDIQAKDVTVNGFIKNNSGTLNFVASDTAGGAVQLNGGLDVVGGVVNLNALAGSVVLGGALNVSNGNLNLESGLYNLDVANSNVQIAGNFVSGNQANGVGNVSFAATGTQEFVLSANNISVGKNIVVGGTGDVVNAVFDAQTIQVGQDLLVQGNSSLGVSLNGKLEVDEQLSVAGGAEFNVLADSVNLGTMLVNGKMTVQTDTIVVNGGDAVVDGDINFNDGANVENGLLVDANVIDDFTLKTTKDNSIISANNINVAENKSLVLNSSGAVTVDGQIDNQGDVSINAVGGVVIAEALENVGGLEITGNTVNMGSITNLSYDNVNISANDGDVVVGGNIINSGSEMNIYASETLSAAVVANSGTGVLTLSADNITSSGVVVTAGQVDLGASTISINGNVSVAGDFVQGITADIIGMLNHNATDFKVGNLTVAGDFIVNAGNTKYEVGANVLIGGDIVAEKGTIATVSAGGQIDALYSNVTNSGMLKLSAQKGMMFDSIVNNFGELYLDSGKGTLIFNSLSINLGNVVLAGTKAYVYDQIDTGAMLYQNWGTMMSAKDINIDADEYLLVTEGLNLKGINQDGNLMVMTSDIAIGTEGIKANNLQFVAHKNTSGETLWQNVFVDADVSGNVDFIGLEKMQITGNYTFNNNSALNVALLPYADGIQLNTTDINYWATVSLNNDNTLGRITNPTGDDARALISVNGVFETDITTVGGLSSDGLANAQIGVDVFDIVDSGTAIWLLHADNGIEDLATKIRNLNVRFCNSDGSLCYSYLDTIKNTGSTDSDDLPVYVAERDTDGDFKIDSLYIVFDPRFGGPFEIFKLQPIVARQDDFTIGEYVSAGAIDNMVAGQMSKKRFDNRTPIELIPVAFKGTNLSKVATELYNRMEYYVANRDGAVFVPFSRLFQVREIEQIAGSVALNEHTAFRSFEDRMLDEFIWNRGRKLDKAWLDVDYGMYFQNVADGKHADGNRFSISGGYDWQATNTLMLGLTGRITHSSSDLSDEMDLSYANVSEAGKVDITVSNTNIGLGAYLMETVNEKARIYGNAFLDIHVLDVERMQNFVAPIDGTGTAFSLISEWGLMHDILNQYIVGNLYARAGYNFGFDVTEKAAGSDYMNLKSDGYFVFTPGYSLVAQKRIYPSAWFQIRPYASIGVEYDVLGMPDNAKYKFVVADKYTYYDVDTNPFWANIGAGVEFVAANGVQVGVDYRYQYNSALQLHNIKVSGSYRF